MQKKSSTQRNKVIMAKEQSSKISEVRPSRLSGIKFGRIGEITSELTELN